MTQRKKQSDESQEQNPEIPQLEAEINRTRSDIGEDLRTLGDKLSPENLKQQAKEVVHEAKSAAVETLHEAKDVATNTFREVKDSTMESVNEKVTELRDGVRRAERQTIGFLRENAVPLALIGIGAAWLFSRNQNGSRRRWPEERYPYLRERYDAEPGGSGGTREWVQQAGQRTRGLAQDAQHRLSDVRDRARDLTEREVEHVRQAARGAGQRVSDAAERAREFTGRELREVRDYSRRVSEENPLALGAAALAAGVGVGLLLPPTRRERELLGEKGQELIGEAKQVIGDLTQTARDTAREVKGSLSSSNPAR